MITKAIIYCRKMKFIKIVLISMTRFILIKYIYIIYDYLLSTGRI